MRKCGALLHISSLPSRYGIGDFGPESVKFASFLRDAGLSMWQILPLTPTEEVMGNSPYSPTSAFAGNFLFISPDMLVCEGFLDKNDPDILNPPSFPTDKTDFTSVWKFKEKLLHRAFDKFQEKKDFAEYEIFFNENRYWLESWSFFAAIRKLKKGQAWYEWEDELKFRTHEALHEVWTKYQKEIEYERFVQFLFHQQAYAFRKMLSEFGIELVGDLPIYVTLDSADVWANPWLFELDEKLAPRSVAGVPPDYFSKTGQLWGNPLYNWDAMREDGFPWWMNRLRHSLKMFDLLRIDHFRGLFGYWSVPVEEKTAERGVWRGVPHGEFFGALMREFPQHPFLAENLGIITQDIIMAMKSMGLPGMIVLHFAWNSVADNSYAPHNNAPDNVIYTGTHDNNTTRGWFKNDATEEEKKTLSLYTGKEIDENNVSEEFIRMALSSVAERAIIQMQDFLNLDGEARVNTPSTPAGNWSWRMSASALNSTLAKNILKKVKIYGRSRA